jgi:hypothetical protein
MMTHGPPMGVLDATYTGEHVGCEHLLRAARRCKPRLHCFGHIHEGWGAQRVTWKGGEDLDVKAEDHIEESEDIQVNMEDAVESRAVGLDVSSECATPLDFGKDTLMVNASIMTVTYKPWNSPWLVDLDLRPCKCIHEVSYYSNRMDVRPSMVEAKCGIETADSMTDLTLGREHRPLPFPRLWVS